MAAVDVALNHAEQSALLRLASATGHVASMARDLSDDDVTAALGDGPTARTAAAALAKVRAAFAPVAVDDTLDRSA